jgi:hypothetical protein
MQGFSREECLEFLKAIFAIAWADCVLKDEEKRLLSEIISYLNPPSDIGEQIYLYFETPIDVGEVNWSCISVSGKYFLLTCAWLMANIDKHLDLREEMILSQMTFLMGLNSEDLEIIKKGNINDEQKSLLKCLGISGEIA